jgi:hypothetical protein
MPWECDDSGNWIDDPNTDTGSCSSETPISYNGKECYLVYVGEWVLSKYVYSFEGDASNADPKVYSHTNEYMTIPVWRGNLSENRRFHFRFLFGSEGLAMQGTGFTIQGEAIRVGNLNGSWQLTSQGFLDYYLGTARFEWGYGGPGYPMTPYYYAAVGPAYYGGTYYVPYLDSLYADTGYDVTGYVFGYDRGGRIPNNRMDVFVGRGLTAYNSSRMPSTTEPQQVFRVVCPGRSNVY